MSAALIAPDAPEYLTIKDAADALAARPWPVAQLVEDGELRAVRFGALVLVSRYDVEQLGGVLDRERNAFEIGRDYQRGLKAEQ